MHTYLALFRGINVSGKNIIKMEQLRKIMAASGFQDVSTYIQSGTVVFKAEEADMEKVAAQLEELVKAEFGHAITIFVLGRRELAKVVEGNLFARPDELEEGTKKIYVTFLSETPLKERFEKLREAISGDDEISLNGNVLYFKLATKASESKLSNNLIESKLKVRATTRNWNTTIKLYNMLEHARAKS